MQNCPLQIQVRAVLRDGPRPARWLFLVAAAALLSALPRNSSFYLPVPERESSPHKYNTGESLNVKVNSLTSINSVMPFSYYSLPFCPPPEGINNSRDSAENLGELLTGDRARNSPYRLTTYTNESDVFLCRTPPLGPDAVALLRKRIDEMYQVNLVLDDLPAIRDVKMKGGYSVRWMGYPIGIRIGVDYYVFNHLQLTVLVHRYDEEDATDVVIPPSTRRPMGHRRGKRHGSGDASSSSSGSGSGWVVVGLEVVPCSIKHNPEYVKSHKMYERYPSKIKCDPSVVSMSIREKEPIVYSYEVSFVESGIEWSSRWDAAYLKLRMDGTTLHWISTLRSLVMVGVVSAILVWTVRRDRRLSLCLTKHEELLIEEELSARRKLVGSDVFRAPSKPMLLCVMVGDGAQILGTGVVTILFAALGWFRLISPASRGALITSVLFLYQVLGILSGYVGVRLWKTIRCGDSSGWVVVSWWVACFFPGIASLILTALSFLLRRSHSTGAIPFRSLLVLLLLWFCVSAPLTLAGGFLGARAPHVEYPAVPVLTTDQQLVHTIIPREIPPRSRKYPSWLLVLVAGTLPFSTLFMELFSVLSSIWTGRPYQAFGFLFTVSLLLVIVCSEVSLVLTYMHLRVEDCKWWWRSFFSSGSVAAYVFLYLINYLVFDLKGLSGPVSTTLYIGYSFVMVIAIMLATGTVGFISSFCFVHYLFSSVKAD